MSRDRRIWERHSSLNSGRMQYKRQRMLLKSDFPFKIVTDSMRVTARQNMSFVRRIYLIYLNWSLSRVCFACVDRIFDFTFITNLFVHSSSLSRGIIETIRNWLKKKVHTLTDDKRLFVLDNKFTWILLFERIVQTFDGHSIHARSVCGNNCILLYCYVR